MEFNQWATYFLIYDRSTGLRFLEMVGKELHLIHFLPSRNCTRASQDIACADFVSFLLDNFQRVKPYHTLVLCGWLCMSGGRSKCSLDLLDFVVHYPSLLRGGAKAVKDVVSCGQTKFYFQ